VSGGKYERKRKEALSDGLHLGVLTIKSQTSGQSQVKFIGKARGGEKGRFREWTGGIPSVSGEA